jgi:hypothetical protein
MKLRFATAAVLSLVVSNVLAASPYAGEEGREAKILTPEQRAMYLRLRGYERPAHITLIDLQMRKNRDIRALTITPAPGKLQRQRLAGESSRCCGHACVCLQ